MQTHCERRGQVELGTIEHAGRQFTAIGSSVQGSQITGYTRKSDGVVSLVRWDGETMLACRSNVVERFSSGSLTLVFRLPKGRFVAGYALGDDGMLFRGELLAEGTDEDARAIAAAMADYFSELDAEDEDFREAV